jgi:hypothetical protein
MVWEFTGAIGDTKGTAQDIKRTSTAGQSRRLTSGGKAVPERSPTSPIRRLHDFDDIICIIRRKLYSEREAAAAK